MVLLGPALALYCTDHPGVRCLVAQAVKVLNMIKVFSKPIRVNKASQDKRQQDVGANLFIGNLDPDVDEKVSTLGHSIRPCPCHKTVWRERQLSHFALVFGSLLHEAQVSCRWSLLLGAEPAADNWA